MRLDRRERFVTDDVLHFAGVFESDFFINAEADENICQNIVTFIDFFGDVSSAFGQRDITVPVNGDIAAAFEEADGAADARL